MFDAAVGYPSRTSLRSGTGEVSLDMAQTVETLQRETYTTIRRRNSR